MTREFQSLKRNGQSKHLNMKRTAIFLIDGYAAVIPQIQNLYAPEKELHVDAWFWGFKYASGVFEFFTVPAKSVAAQQFDEMIAAINAYWCDQK